MDKHYDPQTIEQKWYQVWEDKEYFAPREADDKSAYCIMIPPPNVTGTLHMGHGLTMTIQDTLTRFHRMQGKNTLWQPGTDHAGIATQMVVERQLEAEGKTRHDLGRKDFINRVWDWKEESGGTITRQLRRLGCSLDWSRERFTMDEGLSDAVKEVFVRLYDEGLIYRGKRLVNWDPVLHTAVSDLEVMQEEEDGFMHHVRYPFVAQEDTDAYGHMEIATTRPETILADGALAVSPGDERYSHLLGKEVWVPMTDRKIPIIADDYVDPEFGTGCVKITPAHDFNDWEVGTRHEMEVINLFTPSAVMGENAPKAYQGMDRFEARKQIIKDLEAEGLLVKLEPHKHKPPRGDRSGAVLEPYLTDQWYVKMTPLAEPAIQAVQDGDIRFVPDNWKNTYYRWLEDIQDWCISRQIWWGHQIPAWYDEEGNVYVGRDEAEVRAKHSVADSVVLRQDEDVLDTWFSSALWPFSTLGWPQQTKELEMFYPTSVLVTGFDIIFFWVARMVMFGMKFMDGKIPFHDIYMHGLVRDSHGQKMSKSKGNVLDPIDLIDGIDLESLVVKRTKGLMQTHMKDKIEEQTRKDFPEGIAAYGTDALRFTFASLASTGRDVNFDLGRVEGYRNFCNKIWNATRFVLMQVETQTMPEHTSAYTTADKWIRSRLQTAEAEVTKAMQGYRLDLAAQQIYEFIWHDYCDWYLELAKVTLNDEAIDEAHKQATRHTLVAVLETALRLAHPIIPYITEEIWQRIAPLAQVTGESIMLRPYPVSDPDKQDAEAEADIAWLQEFVLGIRQIRGEMDIAPSKALPVLIQNSTDEDEARLQKLSHWLHKIAKLAVIETVGAEAPAETATALVGQMKVLIPLEGLVDKQAEIDRLDKELSKLEGEIKRVTGKLNNQNFVSKAPEAVVAKEQEKQQALQASFAKLSEQREKLAG